MISKESKKMAIHQDEKIKERLEQAKDAFSDDPEGFIEEVYRIGDEFGIEVDEYTTEERVNTVEETEYMTIDETYFPLVCIGVLARKINDMITAAANGELQEWAQLEIEKLEDYLDSLEEDDE